MRTPTSARGFAIVFVITSVLAVLALLSPNTRVFAQDFPKPGFNEAGELLRPDVSYREWVYVGTPLTPNDLNPPEAAFPVRIKVLEFRTENARHNDHRISVGVLGLDQVVIESAEVRALQCRGAAHERED